MTTSPQETLLCGFQSSPLEDLELSLDEPQSHADDPAGVILAVSNSSRLRTVVLCGLGWHGWPEIDFVTVPVDIRPLMRLHKLRDLTLFLPGSCSQLTRTSENIVDFGKAWPHLTSFTCTESHVARANPDLILESLSTCTHATARPSVCRAGCNHSAVLWHVVCTVAGA